MPAPQNVVAVIFDFDDTLTNDSTSAFLASRGLDPLKFWAEKVDALVKQEWDPSMAFLRAFKDLVGPDRPLGALTNADLRAFGAKLPFYPGLTGMLDDLRRIAAGFTAGRPSVEFYVISGGFEETILGTSIAPQLNGVRACRFDADPQTGQIAAVRNVVDFTEKTRYIFEVNKGVLASTRGDPLKVNAAMKEEDRRVPFDQMIYVGDGLTDIPSFSLIGSRGGRPFAVFDPSRVGSARRAYTEFLSPHRVIGACPADYTETAAAGSLIREAVREMCSRIDHRAGGA